MTHAILEVTYVSSGDVQLISALNEDNLITRLESLQNNPQASRIQVFKLDQTYNRVTSWDNEVPSKTL